MDQFLVQDLRDIIISFNCCTQEHRIIEIHLRSEMLGYEDLFNGDTFILKIH